MNFSKKINNNNIDTKTMSPIKTIVSEAINKTIRCSITDYIINKVCVTDQKSDYDTDLSVTQSNIYESEIDYANMNESDLDGDMIESESDYESESDLNYDPEVRGSGRGSGSTFQIKKEKKLWNISEEIYSKSQIRNKIKVYYNSNRSENQLKSYEIINLDKLESLIKNFWRYYNKNDKKDKHTYNNLQIIREICLDGIYPVTYHQKYKNLGRMNASKYSIQTLPKDIRNYICSDYYNDIDIQNCGYSILYHLCIKNGIEVNYIQKYCEKFEYYRKQLHRLNKTFDYKELKTSFIEILYGRNIYSMNNIKLTSFIKKLYKELKRVRNEFRELEIYNKIYKTLDKNKEERSDKINSNTVFSYMIQDYENKIISKLYNYLKEKKLIKGVFVLMFDGIMILKNGNETKELIREINEHIAKKFNYKFIFTNKEMETNLNMGKCDKVEPIKEILKKLTDYKSIGYFNSQKNTYTNSYEQKDQNENMILEKCNKIVNERYLNIYDDIEKKNVLIIKSNMGTGKTYNIFKYIKNNPDLSVLMVSFRRSLASKYLDDSETNKLGFVNYENLDIEELNSKKSPRLICQINSLYKVSGKYDVLILDEFSYTYDMIYSFCERKKSVCESLESYVSNSKKVIVCDALINKNNIEFIKRFRKEAKIIVNEYQPNDNELILNSKDILEYKITESIKNKYKNPIIIASSSKIFLDKTILPLLQDKKYIYINSDTEFKSKEVDFSKYDYIIYTPTITAGISIECDIEKVFGYFTSLSCSADICYQMLGRARKVIDKEYNICVANRYNNLPITKKDVLKYINNYRNLSYDVYKNMQIDDECLSSFKYDNFNEKYIENGFLNGWIEYQIKINRSKNDLRAELTNLFDLMDIKYKFDRSSKKDIIKACRVIKDNTLLQKTYNLQKLKDKYEEYSKIPVISQEKYEELIKIRKKTIKEKDQINVYLITTILESKIKDLSQSQFKKCMTNFKALKYKYHIKNIKKEDLEPYVLDKVIKSSLNINLNTQSFIRKNDDEKNDTEPICLKIDPNTVNQYSRDYYLRIHVAIELTKNLGLEHSTDLKENINLNNFDLSKFLTKYKQVLIHLFNKREKRLKILIDKKDNYKNVTLIRLYNNILSEIGMKLSKKQKRLNGKHMYIYNMGCSY